MIAADVGDIRRGYEQLQYYCKCIGVVPIPLLCCGNDGLDITDGLDREVEREVAREVDREVDRAFLPAFPDFFGVGVSEEARAMESATATRTAGLGREGT